MLALSTSYLTLRDDDLPGDELARRVLDLGFRAVELDYRVTAAQMKGLGPRLARGELEVVSVHNPFPRDPGVAPADAHHERVRVSSLDRDERRAAVRLGAETLAWAAEVGAGAAVFHVGAVELGDEVDPRELGRLVRRGERESPEYEALRERVAARRRACARPHLDAVLWSLDRLLEEAARRGVAVGIENRYHPEQIPDRGELEALFAEFGGAPLGYWHDTGHAASLVAQGFLESPTELLEAFRGRLLGLHLHDAAGLDDHRAPGEGEVDFAAVARLVSPDARLVLEVHPPAAPEAVVAAQALLAEAGLAGGPRHAPPEPPSRSAIASSRRSSR